MLFYISAFPQSFFKDYTSHLEGLNHRSDWSKHKKHLFAKKSAKRLQKVFDEVKLKENISMLKSDTIYIIDYSTPTTNQISKLIWNKNHSCFYEFSLLTKKDYLKINTNAIVLIDNLQTGFKNLVEKIDTSGFNAFIKNYNFNYKSVGFTVAIKKNKHWKFILSKTYYVSTDIADALFISQNSLALTNIKSLVSSSQQGN